MASVSRQVDLVERILEYAHKTKIEFAITPRFSGWDKFGLPDLRGFCPHLRRVNLYQDHAKFQLKDNLKAQVKKELTAGKPEQGLWLLHDILHIVFYDFATLNLGKKSWSVSERFLENHLASEFFAVLLLDYHFLIYTKTKGLAVSLDYKSWPAFMKKNPLLPPLDSFAFAKVLFDIYFEGQSIIINDKSLKKLDEWVGHELRYAKKQRVYVLQWWEDLQGLKSSKKEAQIFDSQAYYAAWELLGIFLDSNKKEWAQYLSKISQDKNNFSNLKKYKKHETNYDFKFTDIQGLKKEEVITAISNADKKDSSNLFLMWQIISTFKPNRFDRRTKDQFSELASVTNKTIPSHELWNTIKEVLTSTVKGPHFGYKNPQPQTIATFFLP